MLIPAPQVEEFGAICVLSDGDHSSDKDEATTENVVVHIAKKPQAFMLTALTFNPSKWVQFKGQGARLAPGMAQLLM